MARTVQSPGRPPAWRAFGGTRQSPVELFARSTNRAEGVFMWPRTDFLELLGLSHPIVQAPMSGFTPPMLAAAVCNAGALGSIGCAGLPPAVVREEVAA